ncbi:MAG: hypothetical protein LBP31_00595 [Holosporales bacterium]|jgi:hypothetical protein|nr:hypothetical protein [Holosporales bacterium]
MLKRMIWGVGMVAALGTSCVLASSKDEANGSSQVTTPSTVPDPNNNSFGFNNGDPSKGIEEVSTSSNSSSSSGSEEFDEEAFWKQLETHTKETEDVRSLLNYDSPEKLSQRIQELYNEYKTIEHDDTPEAIKRRQQIKGAIKLVADRVPGEITYESDTQPEAGALGFHQSDDQEVIIEAIQLQDKIDGKVPRTKASILAWLF